MGPATVSGQTVLVTGGAGFIGSHLVEELAEANEVRVIDNLASGRRERVPEEVTFVEGDVRDEATISEVMEGVDLVFHEAAQVDVAASVEAPRETHAVNATATLSILENARMTGASVVLASSAAVYGDPESVPVDEDAPTAPRSPYGVSKLIVDQYGRVFDELYDIEVVPLRYFNVYGPRQSGGQYSGVVDVFLRQALAGEPLTVHGAGEQTRDFVHVVDVVRANLMAATTDLTGEPINIATGESISIRGLAELVRTITAADVDIVHTDPRPGDVGRSRGDITRARDRLGYEPVVGLQEGLKDLTERYRALVVE